ncbi:hypothetical protein BKA70DRAFT_1227272 [Coprinopsis sp. MPI-PUGE-AT-0042]|nr:hypothetical protein BKA70DRAFT_1227272 [Coprinopsis sp. MPI-PUGE-AT-0042]
MPIEVDAEGSRFTVEVEVSLQDGSVHSMLMGVRQSELRPSRMVDQSQPRCFHGFLETTIFALATLAVRHTHRAPEPWKIHNSASKSPVFEIWMRSTRCGGRWVLWGTAVASTSTRVRYQHSKFSNIPGTSASLKIPNRSKDRINLHMREVSIRKPGIKKRRTGLECPNYYLFDDSGSFTSYGRLTGSWETPSSVHHYLTDNSVNWCTSFADTWYRNCLASDLALHPPSMPEWGVTMGEVKLVLSVF